MSQLIFVFLIICYFTIVLFILANVLQLISPFPLSPPKQQHFWLLHHTGGLQALQIQETID